jgi:hypothetical protein
MKRLQKVVAKLEVPKAQYNSFGKYDYRSLEDILEAVKPLLTEEGLSLIISDSIEVIGERFYVKATATIYDENGKKIAEATAFAREAQTKKGMDESQITGATSSYARKYCLNGLFCIDDVKDADGGEKPKQQPQKWKMTDKQRGLMNALISKAGSDRDKIKNAYGVKSLNDLTQSQFDNLIEALNKKIGK